STGGDPGPDASWARRRKPHSEIGGTRRGNPSRPADAGPCKRTSRWWIDRSGTGDTPCNPVANRPRLCLELPPRKPSWPAVMCDRTHRPDIWMQANRAEHPPGRLEGQGPSTYGLLRRCAPRNDGGKNASCAPSPARRDLGLYLVEDLRRFAALDAGDVVLVFRQDAERVVDGLGVEDQGV